MTRPPSQGQPQPPAEVARADLSDRDGDEDEPIICQEDDIFPSDVPDKVSRALSRDIGVVMRTRAERGYGLHDVNRSLHPTSCFLADTYFPTQMERNSVVAAELEEQPLVDFWNWFGRESEIPSHLASGILLTLVVFL